MLVMIIWWYVKTIGTLKYEDRKIRTGAAMVPRQSLAVQIRNKIPMFSMRRHIGQDGVLNETRTAERWVESSYAHAQLSKFTSRSRPSSSGGEVFMAFIAPL